MSLLQQGLRGIGAWEPLHFKIRCGGDPEQTIAVHHRREAKDYIKRLKKQGYNLYIIAFEKGFGLTAEAEERERTRRITELCHKHGIYAGGYLRYTTFVPDTVKQDVPDCIERFACRNSEGKFPRYGVQGFRYLPCPTSTDYLEWLGQFIKIGVRDIGLDLLHIDGLDMIAEPWACKCDRCKAGFREWLQTRYPTSAAQKYRFGFSGMEFVDPPDVTNMHPIQLPLPIMSDPIFQEWTFYHTHLLKEVWTFIVGTAHRLNPKCVIQGNGQFNPARNNAFYGGMDIELMSEVGSEGFYTEEGPGNDLLPNGRIRGFFETFKKLRGLGITVYTGNSMPETGPMERRHEHLKRDMAAQMAFNLDAVGMGGGEAPEYMAFHRDRRDLFHGVAPSHDAAIYHSERTRVLNCGTPIATTQLAMDVMLRGHVPFGYLLSSRRKDLRKFRALVLPETECMTDKEAEDIARYARGGGGILILGPNTGAFDEFRHAHKKNVLIHKLGIEERIGLSAFTARVGKGRVAFMRELITPQGNPQKIVDYWIKLHKDRRIPGFAMNPWEWNTPLNAAQFLSLLRWVGDGYRFEPIMADSVAVEFVKQEKKKRYLIHLVNFDLDNDVGPFEIICRGLKSQKAQAFTPDGKAPAVKIIKKDGRETIVQIKGFHRYLIVAAS